MPENRLFFRPFGKSVSGLTDIWDVINKENSYLLGTIRWFGAWRKYVFYPLPDCLFDTNCLKEIAEFLDVEMQKWRTQHDVKRLEDKQ